MDLSAFTYNRIADDLCAIVEAATGEPATLRSPLPPSAGDVVQLVQRGLAERGYPVALIALADEEVIAGVPVVGGIAGEVWRARLALEARLARQQS